MSARNLVIVMHQVEREVDEGREKEGAKEQRRLERNQTRQQ